MAGQWRVAALTVSSASRVEACRAYGLQFCSAHAVNQPIFLFDRLGGNRFD